ncbi:MAG: hypothetical protein JXN60_05510 [Lentisphaerae bacterium]|nr:hypothetical protein [Lentisphaerota bacterium]
MAGGIIMATGCMEKFEEGTFGADVAFLKKHVDVVLLTRGDSAVALVPQYQGRVMTSTVGGANGPSFGWLNYEVIKKGLLQPEKRKGSLEDHIHVFGGEERFWLGPEGGQFAIFFAPGSEFVFDNWHTPAAIDTDAYELVSQNEDSAKFTHKCELLNWSGAKFDVLVERTIRLLDSAAIEKVLKQPIAEGVKTVAYESENRITNNGNAAWTEKSGMLSIWLLGMYKPSSGTTVVIPFKEGAKWRLGMKVNDTYFGKLPPEYLKVEDNVAFLKGDGTRRGKIGVSPKRSLGVAGSYDANGKMLTIVVYNQPYKYSGYVNSMWELQRHPFVGDAVNAYNDGSPEPGKPPLGPFYELETSSPAADLDPGESMTHIQKTIHVTGPEHLLDPIARKTLGVGIEEIKKAL